MPVSQKSPQGVASIVVTLLVLLLACEDALAQGRGGGRRRGGGGGVDLSPIRNDRYSDLPSGAYDLVKGNEQTFNRLPLPIRSYVLNSLAAWDDFFPREKERFRYFFARAGEVSDGDLREAFGEAIAGIFPRRMGPRQRRDGGDGQGIGRRQGPGRRGGMGQRGDSARRRHQSPDIQIMPEQRARIDTAFNRFVYKGVDFPPALLAIAIMPGKTGTSDSTFNDSLIAQGTLLQTAPAPDLTKRWLATLLTGRDDALKGDKLVHPTLFEYHNRAIKDKTRARTLALYMDDSAPPERSTHRKYRKFGPLSVRASSLTGAAETVRQALDEARSDGRSQAFIENVVYPTLDPKKLKITKTVKDKVLSRLIVRTLLSSDRNLKLKNSFLSSLAFACLPRAQPDLMLLQLADSPDSRRTIEQLREIVQGHHRYRNRTTLAVLDAAAGRALLLGPDMPAGLRVAESLSPRDLSATLFGLGNVDAEFAQGKPVDFAFRN
ncbi:MAG: hypothetical protein OXR72_02820 [Gemmatimonadota bacterium]|nr:hypothetical protein [Gemmatimonadota bacterium]